MSALLSPSKSWTPTMAQLLGTAPTVAVDLTVGALRNQTPTFPLAPPRHSRSSLPSALKSAWPTIDQLVGTVPSEAVPATVAPFIAHSATAPVPFCRQTISLVPL